MIKAIGLDLGSKTLGVAYNDFLGIVHTVETFRFPFEKYDLAVEEVIKLVKKYDTKIIALGYPINMNGSESERSKKTLEFKKMLLNKDSSLNISLIDERLTTIQAHNYLNEMDVTSKKRKEVVDQLAAYEILTTFLKMKENGQL
ncbi:MAG: Holliday junction resolvase RuvX [Bacilli bacterium]